jgi:hypothetical protein
VGPQFQSLSPLWSTTDMTRMQAHYEALGFVVRIHTPAYGTASRDGFNLHFQLADGVAAVASGSAYFGVRDADALHAEWSSAGVGDLAELHDPGFGVWESALTDADGNIIRFGSPLP